ncbi:hypothetical protein [Azospirillum sp. B510]|uniref:hypothetical protein n=1 Tax=Azospirillum sp. (strain B510) TaxID=137722 RepID=UPI0002E6461C|nr:hypothetical protein [Azospirillum sp. B510]
MPIVLGVARGAPEEAHAIRWTLLERETGLSEPLAYAARAVARVRGLSLPDDRIAPAYRRAVAADPALAAFFSAVDDWPRLRVEAQRRPMAAVLRWREIGEALLDGI